MAVGDLACRIGTLLISPTPAIPPIFGLNLLERAKAQQQYLSAWGVIAANLEPDRIRYSMDSTSYRPRASRSLVAFNCSHNLVSPRIVSRRLTPGISVGIALTRYQNKEGAPIYSDYPTKFPLPMYPILLGSKRKIKKVECICQDDVFHYLHKTWLQVQWGL